MRLFRLLLLATLFAPAALAQQNQQFLLDINDNSNVPVSNLGPQGGTVPVHVVYTGGDPTVKSVTVFPSRFSTDQDSVAVEVLSSCDAGVAQGAGGQAAGASGTGAGTTGPGGAAGPGGAGIQTTTIPLSDHGTASFCLRVPQLGTDGKYAGTLTFFFGLGKSEAKRFTLSRPAASAATLATDQPTITLQLERNFLAPFSSRWAFDAPIATLALQEKSGKGLARGVATQIDSAWKAPPGSFNPRTSLNFQWNGKAWDHPFSTPPNSTEREADGGPILQSLAPGTQAEVTITGKNLQPGEYSIPLRFTAPGATADNARVAITLQVRDSWVLAVIALVLALILSFVITKVLSGMQRRIDLRQKIRELRLSKGDGLPPLPAVVWVDAMLHLAERLSSRFWLSNADAIEDRVNSVCSTVEILKQVRELRTNLQEHLHLLFFLRAAESIDHTVAELGAEPPDEATAARIKAELSKFNDWLQDGTFPAALWTSIQPALQNLQRDIAAGVVPANVQPVIQPLKTLLDTALQTPPQDAAGVEDSYRNYARLRILWDCRNEADVFAQLSVNPPVQLQECFHLYDDLIWKRLKESRQSLKIEMPSSSSPEGLESFAPLPFYISSTDSKIGDSYLFRHKVRYAWKFTLGPGTSGLIDRIYYWLRRRKPKPVILTPTTLGPAVVQYFPSAGTVKAEVTLSYSGEPINLAGDAQPQIYDSGDFGAFRAFAGVEYVSWGIAAIVALATGLSTYYFQKPTFGSYQDYVTLGLWGVGMDQGKNFLQALQQVSTKPAGTKTTP